MTIKLSGDLVDKLTEALTANSDSEAEAISKVVQELEAAIIVEVEGHLVQAVERNFAEQPVSITEARASRSESGSDWTPKDCLLSVLRKIDGGDLKVDNLVVVYSQDHEDGLVNTGYRSACRSYYNTVGLLSTVQHMIMAGD